VPKNYKGGDWLHLIPGGSHASRQETSGTNSLINSVGLFRDNPRFCAKIALIDRVQWFPGEKSATEDHAWYVWSSVRGPGIGQARLIYQGREGTAVQNQQPAA
jgi:hypothetical protein